MSDLERRILAVFNGKATLSALATKTSDGRPWVRYVMIEASDDMTFRCTSFITARKVEQIKHDSEVHLTCGISDPARLHDPYLQIQGRAVFATDQAEREAFWSDRLKVIFDGPGDPRYGVVVINAYRIEYTQVGLPVEVWTRAVSPAPEPTAAWHKTHR